jgi:hypothetical protein
MIPTELHEMFIDRPECLLALMFSTPAVNPDEIVSSVTVDFTEAEVIAQVRRQSEGRRAPRLLGTKQTIFAAILLYHFDLGERPRLCLLMY